MKYTLYVGTKNYSSWSLRPWLAMKVAGIDFREVVIGLRQPDTAARIREQSPSGKVPLLVIEDNAKQERVWDSLAICETVAERFPGAQLWPASPSARALARSISAEMHAGFPELRAALPMDIVGRNATPELSQAVSQQITRIQQIWSDALSRYGGGEGFLFGRFSIADAFYAPVVTRFVTHAIELPPNLHAYSARVLSLPAMREWASAAETEMSQ